MDEVLAKRFAGVSNSAIYNVVSKKRKTFKKHTFPASITRTWSDSKIVFKRCLEIYLLALTNTDQQKKISYAIVSIVTSANAGPRIISWMAWSVSRSTAEVARYIFKY